MAAFICALKSAQTDELLDFFLFYHDTKMY